MLRNATLDLAHLLRREPRQFRFINAIPQFLRYLDALGRRELQELF